MRRDRGAGRGGRSRPRALAGAGLGLLVSLGLAGCGGDRAAPEGSGAPEGDAPLLVLAAADLQAAFELLVPHFEASTGIRVETVLGSTGNLSAQIRHGAPADLFFSANERFLDDLVTSGRIAADSRTPYAVGRLAVAVPPGRTLPESIGALGEDASGLVGIANPEHAPYGMAAVEVLRALGIDAAVRDRLVFAENAAHTVQFVRTGNVDVGLVALPLVQDVPGTPLPHRIVDASLHAPLLQVAGVVSESRRVDAARAFLAFVLSEEGQAILRRHGFESPPSVDR